MTRIFTFHAAAKLVNTVTAVNSITKLAFGHNGACIAFIILVTCRTHKLRVCHFKTPIFGICLFLEDKSGQPVYLTDQRSELLKLV